MLFQMAVSQEVVSIRLNCCRFFDGLTGEKTERKQGMDGKKTNLVSFQFYSECEEKIRQSVNPPFSEGKFTFAVSAL